MRDLMVEFYMHQRTVMDENEQAPEVQSPLQRAMVTASIACFVSLVSFYYVARPAVAVLESWWVEGLVYAVIPLAVTFVILYRSCWHEEITGAARTWSVLLLSGVILAGVLLAIGIMLGMILFCANAVTGGNH
jgi:hypothetical protein